MIFVISNINIKSGDFLLIFLLIWQQLRTLIDFIFQIENIF